jgi:molybdenum cofactor cytidylyltransferase
MTDPVSASQPVEHPAPVASANISPVTVAVLLAAGGGRRYTGDTHKLMAPLRGRPVSAWALDAVMAAGFTDVIVVTGSAPSEIGTLAADAASGSPTHLHLAHNGSWEQGQATSVHRGIVAASALGATSIVVGLADQPFVHPEAWRAVATAPAVIAVATYDGRRGNPVRLAAEVWPLLPHDGDEGARSLMRLRPELVQEVPCQGSAADIDTLEDLDRWT